MCRQFVVKVRATQFYDGETSMGLQQQQSRTNPYEMHVSEQPPIQPPSILIRVTNTLFKAVTRTFEGMTTTKGDLPPGKTPPNDTPGPANESICAELVRAGVNKTPNEAFFPATFRERDNSKGVEEEKGTKSARGSDTNTIISKSDIRIETHGKIEEQLCVICYVKKTNAVLMPCCHGGICYECALRISKQKAICHFCRQEILQVIKIDFEENGSTDFFKISDKWDVPLNRKLITTKPAL